MSRRRVVVTGLGLISPVGNTVAEGWGNLVAGRSGIANVTRFDASALACRFAGEVKGFNVEEYFPAKEARHMDTFIHYGMAASIQAVRDALVVLLAFGLFSLGAKLQAVTVPMLVALGLAYLFEPVIAWASSRWNWATRARLVVAVLTGLLVTLGLILALLLPLALSQGATLVRNAPGYLDRAATWLESPKAPELLRPIGEQIRLLWEDPASAGRGGEAPQASPTAGADGGGAGGRRTQSHPPANGAEPLVQQPQTQGGEEGLPVSAIGRTVTVVWEFLGKVVITFFDIVLTLFLIGFFFAVFATSWPQVLAFGDSLLPAANRDRIRELLGKMDRAVSAFVRGRLIICAALGLLFAVGWSICGVPHAVLRELFTDGGAGTLIRAG